MKSEREKNENKGSAMVKKLDRDRKFKKCDRKKIVDRKMTHDLKKRDGYDQKYHLSQKVSPLIDH